ncbi:MerR family transcriptional regulator [Frankia sp. AiPs1]|uniref:MerR family transcriptional regulator n=1 Tax=Frankia sp. AiPa1 TaxID=573492 RepID=UPI00202AEAE2|nr:MerR family transcriptional regulator [Frankia sp. AiPa1]MCL9758566.1 MerR family transcriptional regulator [Frankia sp. AiPa1]
MRIGDLAAQTGVSVRSLRYYEEQGLLSSSRSPSGQRTYVASDVERVRFLRRLYAAGLSSRTIIDLLPCVDSPNEESADDAWTRMAEERARLDRHITELLHARDRLDEIIAVNRHARASMN